MNFPSIPGIIEDVTEIILNIKQLALKLSDVEALKNIYKAKGPLEIKVKILIVARMLKF